MGTVGFHHLLLAPMSVFFIECVFKLVLSNFGDFKEANKTCTSRACPHVCSITRMWDLIWWKFIFSVDSVRLETLHVHFYRPKTQFVGRRNELRPFVEREQWQSEWVNAWTPPPLQKKNVFFPHFCASFQLFSLLNVCHSCWALILAVSSGFTLANLPVSGRQKQIFRADFCAWMSRWSVDVLRAEVCKRDRTRSHPLFISWTEKKKYVSL